jgi:hypothetical protein
MSSNIKVKSLLKPSSLAQHTVNFNKQLEQVPTPSMHELELNLAHDQSVESVTKNDNEPQATHEPSTAFVFGEKLSERVTNADNPVDEDTPQPVQALQPQLPVNTPAELDQDKTVGKVSTQTVRFLVLSKKLLIT